MHAHRRGRLRPRLRLWIICILALLAVTPGACRAGQDVGPQAAAVSPLDSPLPTAPSLISPWFTSELGALYRARYFTVRPPLGWLVEEAEDGRYLALTPPPEQSFPANKIEIAYLGYDMEPGDDLLEWDMLYSRAAGVEVNGIDVVSKTTALDVRGAAVQRSSKRAGAAGTAAYSILLTHGNLVLAASAYTHDPAATALLERVAGTITFAPNGPRSVREFPGMETTSLYTLSQLYAQQEPPTLIPPPTPPPAVELDTPQQTRYYSLRTPAGWSVSETDNGRHVVITPPDQSFPSKIDIAYIGYDVRPIGSLSQWYSAYPGFGGNGPVAGAPPLIGASEVRTMSPYNAAGVEIQRVGVRAWKGQGDEVYFVVLAYGNLVLAATIYTHEQPAIDLLERITTTIRFTPDAPHSVKDFPAGDDAAGTLARVTVAYDRSVSSMHAALAVDFAPDPADPTLGIASSVGGCSGPFHMTAPLADWELVETGLLHQHLAGCALNLFTCGRGGPESPVIDEPSVTLGDFTWSVDHWPAASMLIYAGPTGILFQVNYSSDAPEEAISACREAVESVLATIAFD
jgi:hypothetical protein